MATVIPGVKFESESPGIVLKKPERDGKQYKVGQYDPATDLLALTDEQGQTTTLNASRWLIQVPDQAGGDWLIGKTRDLPFPTRAEAQAVMEQMGVAGAELRRVWAREDYPK